MVVGGSAWSILTLILIARDSPPHPVRPGLRPVNDPLIARFADACGATAPLDLRVDLAGGSVLAEGSVAQPFTLVGRDDACDVTLSDPEINPRHAWLQVLGGRVFAVDLGSRTGLVVARRRPRAGLARRRHVRPASARSCSGSARRSTDRPNPYPLDYNPLASDPAAKARPGVALEFRNGRRAKDRWHVNRLLTLIGRAADCKIHLTADDISPVPLRARVHARRAVGRRPVRPRGGGQRRADAGRPAAARGGAVGRSVPDRLPVQVPPASVPLTPARPPAGKSGRLAATWCQRRVPGSTAPLPAKRGSRSPRRRSFRAPSRSDAVRSRLGRTRRPIPKALR